MLNLIKSIIVATISLLVALISFIRGPLLVGLITLVTILAVTKNASASTSISPVYQCNHVSCTAWEMMSFSQHMAVVLWVISCVLLFVLLHNSRKEKEARKSVFQVELDAAIKAYNNR